MRSEFFEFEEVRPFSALITEVASIARRNRNTATPAVVLLACNGAALHSIDVAACDAHMRHAVTVRGVAASGQFFAAVPVFDLLKALPKRGKARFEVTMASGDAKGATLRITSGSATRTLKAPLQRSEVPSWPSLDGARGDSLWQTLDATNFVAPLRHVLPAVCRDDARYSLTGAAFVRIDGGDHWAATDGHRLHCTPARNLGWLVPEGDDDEQFMLPRACLPNLLDLVESLPAGAVEARLVESGLRFFAVRYRDKSRGLDVVGDVHVRCVEGQFPDFTQVTPPEHRTRVTFTVDAFRAAYAKLSPVLPSTAANPRNCPPLVVTARGNGTITLTLDDESGKARASVEFAAVVEGFRYAHFNARYLAEAVESLATITSPALELLGEDDMVPFVLKPIGEEARRDATYCVVMPMRLDAKNNAPSGFAPYPEDLDEIGPLARSFGERRESPVAPAPVVPVAPVVSLKPRRVVTPSIAPPVATDNPLAFLLAA